MKYAASIDIAAPPEQVWSVLVAAADWPDWEDNVTRIEGTIADGQAITVHTRLSSRAFPVQVGDWQPARRMTWTGGMPLGLFKGVRTFDLSPTEDGGTHVDVQEEFTGLLRPLMAMTMPDLQPSFDAFVRCLKQRVEAS